MRLRALGGRREGPRGLVLGSLGAARRSGAGAARLSGADARGHLQRPPHPVPGMSPRRGPPCPPCPVLSQSDLNPPMPKKWVEESISNPPPDHPLPRESRWPLSRGLRTAVERSAALFLRHLLWIPNRNVALGDSGPGSQCPGVGVLGCTVHPGGRAWGGGPGLCGSAWEGGAEWRRGLSWASRGADRRARPLPSALRPPPSSLPLSPARASVCSAAARKCRRCAAQHPRRRQRAGPPAPPPRPRPRPGPEQAPRAGPAERSARPQRVWAPAGPSRPSPHSRLLSLAWRWTSPPLGSPRFAAAETREGLRLLERGGPPSVRQEAWAFPLTAPAPGARRPPPTAPPLCVFGFRALPQPAAPSSFPVPKAVSCWLRYCPRVTRGRGELASHRLDKLRHGGLPLPCCLPVRGGAGVPPGLRGCPGEIQRYVVPALGPRSLARIREATATFP